MSLGVLPEKETVPSDYRTLWLPLSGGHRFGMCGPRQLSAADFDLVIETLNRWRTTMAPDEPFTLGSQAK
jgi:hypothetical protein